MLYSYVTLSFSRFTNQAKLKVHFPPKELKSLMIDTTKMTNTQTKTYMLYLAKQNKSSKSRGQKALYHSIVIFIPSFACLPA
jgi:hypothetical protein